MRLQLDQLDAQPRVRLAQRGERARQQGARGGRERGEPDAAGQLRRGARQRRVRALERGEHVVGVREQQRARSRSAGCRGRGARSARGRPRARARRAAGTPPTACSRAPRRRRTRCRARRPRAGRAGGGCRAGEATATRSREERFACASTRARPTMHAHVTRLGRRRPHRRPLGVRVRGDPCGARGLQRGRAVRPAAARSRRSRWPRRRRRRPAPARGARPAGDLRRRRDRHEGLPAAAQHRRAHDHGGHREPAREHGPDLRRAVRVADPRGAAHTRAARRARGRVRRRARDRARPGRRRRAVSAAR